MRDSANGTPASGIVHVLWSGEIGGAERAVHQLACHQHAAGTREVAVAFGQAKGHYCDLARASGLRVLDLGMSSARDLRAARRAASTFQEYGIHHFHVAEPALMLASASVRGAGRVYTHRGGATAYRGTRALRYRALGPLLRRRFTLTGTAQAARAAARLFGTREEEILTTFNGYDPALLEPTMPPERLREAEGVPPGHALVGTAANLRAWKRIDWLIEAAGRLPGEDWAVWVLGDGPDRSRLEALAASSPAAQRIRFLGARTAIADWLRALDVFVMPSGPQESFGNAVVEAMACAIPVVVASDCPAHTAHVEHAATGLVAKDAVDLGEQVSELLGDRALRERLGHAGQRFVADTYSMERAHDRFEEIYDRLTRVTGASLP